MLPAGAFLFPEGMGQGPGGQVQQPGAPFGGGGDQPPGPAGAREEEAVSAADSAAGPVAVDGGPARAGRSRRHGPGTPGRTSRAHAPGASLGSHLRESSPSRTTASSAEWRLPTSGIRRSMRGPIRYRPDIRQTRLRPESVWRDRRRSASENAHAIHGQLFRAI